MNHELEVHTANCAIRVDSYIDHKGVYAMMTCWSCKSILPVNGPKEASDKTWRHSIEVRCNRCGARYEIKTTRLDKVENG